MKTCNYRKTAADLMSHISYRDSTAEPNYDNIVADPISYATPTDSIIKAQALLETNYIPRLTRFEQDLIDLYYKEGMPQKQIAGIFGCSQGTVSLTLKKSYRVIKYLQQIEVYTEENVKGMMIRIIPRYWIAGKYKNICYRTNYEDRIDAYTKMLMALLHTTNQTETARILRRTTNLRITQDGISSLLKVIQDYAVKNNAQDVLKLLSIISENQLILSKVQAGKSTKPRHNLPEQLYGETSEV